MSKKCPELFAGYHEDQKFLAIVDKMLLATGVEFDTCIYEAREQLSIIMHEQIGEEALRQAIDNAAWFLDNNDHCIGHVLTTRYIISEL